MRKVIMGVGIPGSGKTAFLKPFALKQSYTYISPDEIRAELLGDAADQSKNQEVWDEAYRRVAASLFRGETVVFDATFSENDKRKEFIAFARRNGATKVQGVFSAVPLEIANERNRQRTRVVPDHVLRRMHASLMEHPPTVEEGFDAVFDLNEFQELERGELSSDNEKQWHKEFRNRPK
jgi:predicted kinase